MRANYKKVEEAIRDEIKVEGAAYILDIAGRTGYGPNVVETLIRNRKGHNHWIIGKDSGGKYVRPSEDSDPINLLGLAVVEVLKADMEDVDFAASRIMKTKDRIKVSDVMSLTGFPSEYRAVQAREIIKRMAQARGWVQDGKYWRVKDGIKPLADQPEPYQIFNVAYRDFSNAAADYQDVLERFRVNDLSDGLIQRFEKEIDDWDGEYGSKRMAVNTKDGKIIVSAIAEYQLSAANQMSKLRAIQLLKGVVALKGISRLNESCVLAASQMSESDALELLNEIVHLNNNMTKLDREIVRLIRGGKLDVANSEHDLRPDVLYVIDRFDPKSLVMVQKDSDEPVVSTVLAKEGDLTTAKVDYVEPRFGFVYVHSISGKQSKSE